MPRDLYALVRSFYYPLLELLSHIPTPLLELLSHINTA